MEQTTNCGVLPLEAMDSPSAIRNIWNWLDENFEKVFLVSGLLAIIFLITFQTLYRYVIVHFVSSAGAAVWTEELARYIFIWISYLALSVAIKKRSSIRIDIVYDRIPVRWQNASWVVVDIFFLILTLTICWYGWTQIERLMEFPKHTTALRIPYIIPYLVLPLGFGLMALSCRISEPRSHSVERLTPSLRLPSSAPSSLRPFSRNTSNRCRPCSDISESCA